ncbi:MAG: tetratricopeptide repeat protein [Nitrospirae bacterium]|nr:tetratricopeptide repeat protein [Nitrospirota bacterium]
MPPVLQQRLLNLLLFLIIGSSFTYLTYERNKVWLNDFTLWRDSVEKAPDNARAHNNLGRAYGAQGRDPDAIGEFKKAITILPNYALAHMNLAVSYSKIGINSEAESHFEEALRFYPNMPETYYNYGFFLYSTERYEEAHQILNEYLRLSPTGQFVRWASKLISNIENKSYER